MLARLRTPGARATWFSLKTDVDVVDNQSVYWFLTWYKLQSKLFLQGHRQREAIVRRRRAWSGVGPGAKGFG